MEAINLKRKPSNLEKFRKEAKEMSDLHNRLFNKLKENNLPQPGVSREEKHHFREIAVGWSALNIKFNFREELSDFVEGVLRVLDDENARGLF